MDHSFFSLHQLDDRTDGVEDFDNFSFIDITDLDFLQDIQDEGLSRFSCCLIFRRDCTLSIILEIDLDSIVFLDSLDRLASLSDDFSHLLLRDKDREEKRSIRRKLGSRS